jgi:hypothetical protein
MKIQTKEDLENLIANKAEENLSLEYKDGRALSDTKEIAKDVSAFANSAGGVIIYGIKEFDEVDKKHLPEKITPIDRKSFSKEWLEQVINSNISPKIEGLKIVSISLSDNNDVAYVVEIPQGSTAHQNTKDHRYYKRYNFKSEPMLDYEIRDILNRMKHPVIELYCEMMLVEEDYEVEAQRPFINSHYEKRENLYLVLRPFNKGGCYAEFVNYFVELPKNILPEKESERLKNISADHVEFYGENTFRDVVDYKFLGIGKAIPKYGASRFDPILPGLYGRSEKILLLKNSNFRDHEIKWRVHADNALIQTGSIFLNQIPVKKEC